jgi:sugar lactone lactonase YvrE
MATRTTAHVGRRRMIFAVAATSAALAAFTLPAGAATTAASAHDGEKGAYAITIDGGKAYPESIAAGDHYIYTGSIDDGTVYRGRLGAKVLEPFLPGGQDGRTQVTGMKVDGERLLIAGAFTGRFFIYTDTGKLVASYTVPDTGTSTLVNDEAVASNGDVYITDSFRSVLYRIPAAEVNAPATGAHRTLQVFHQLPDYVAGQSNGNGIVATPDGRALIIGYWYSGALYKFTLATGEIRKIEAPALTSADGIARQGNTLYIARSVDNEVATVRLSEDETRATVVSERTYPGADTTTGVAISGDRLLVTNSQMNNYLYGAPLESPVFTVQDLPLR